MLFSVDKALALLILHRLRQHAVGRVKRPDVIRDLIKSGKTIFTVEIKETETILVCEYAIMYSPRISCYSNAIRVWSIERDHSSVQRSKRELSDSIQSGKKSMLTKSLVSIGGNYMPGDGPFKYVPFAQTGPEGSNIVQLFQLSSRMAECIQFASIGTAAREFPFSPAEEEHTVMQKASDPCSALILGRSGTGKTTILLAKMFDEYCVHCAKKEEYHQIFVTCNEVLVNSVSSCVNS